MWSPSPQNPSCTAQALADQVRERGILSRPQVRRLIAQDPERISFAILGALCDVPGVEPRELIVFTASEARTIPWRAIGNATPLPDLRDYGPVRARISTANAPADTFSNAHSDAPSQMEWEYLLLTAKKQTGKSGRIGQ